MDMNLQSSLEAEGMCWGGNGANGGIVVYDSTIGLMMKRRKKEFNKNTSFGDDGHD